MDTADKGPLCKVPYLSGSAQVQLIGVDRVALSFFPSLRWMMMVMSIMAMVMMMLIVVDRF